MNARDPLTCVVTPLPSTLMPEYRRMFRAGGTFFFTLVTRRRRPLFAEARHVQRIRHAIRMTRAERPFHLEAGVILPDHLHLLWTLPADDDAYPARIGRMKLLFSQSMGVAAADRLPSETRHREAGWWQRRFWEHVIRDEADFQRHLDYIHYNPVKHGHATCPHAWPHSSFQSWVEKRAYEPSWLCVCAGRHAAAPDFDLIAGSVGE